MRAVARTIMASEWGEKVRMKLLQKKKKKKKYH